MTSLYSTCNCTSVKDYTVPRVPDLSELAPPPPLRKRVCLSGGQNDDFRPLTSTLGGETWCAGTNMWHPETPASYELLPAPLATQILTLWMHKSRGRGRGGALILDRCRAFDLFASVDAHLCVFPPKPKGGGATLACRWRGGVPISDDWRESLALTNHCFRLLR